MSDKLPGSSSSNPIKYRDYEIYLNPDWHSHHDRWVYHHEGYDGPEDNRYGFTSTEQEAKDEIDEEYDDV